MAEMKEFVSAFKEGAKSDDEGLVSSKIYELLKKLVDGKELSAEEKDYVFHGLVNARKSYGNGTAATAYGVKLDFSKWLKRYLVKYYGENHFEIYFSFDESQIKRNQFTRAGIVEIIQA